MSPGLPGLGLGGLFFIFTALLAPAIELVRTARGQSSRQAWRSVGRQFAIAVVMIIAVDLTVRGALFAASLAGAGEGPSDRGLTVLPLEPLGITVALLGMVLGGVKALELGLRVRDRGLPRVSVAAAGSLGYRIVPTGGALAAVWLAMLLFGAPELNSVPGDGGPGGPEPAIAAKRDGTDGGSPAARANTDGQRPGAAAGDDNGRRSGTVAEAARSPSGTVGDPTPDRPAERPAGGGDDAVAGETPPDVAPAPDQEATTVEGPSGEVPPGPPPVPPGRDGLDPGPPPHASAPAGVGGPATTGSPSGT